MKVKPTLRQVEQLLSRFGYAKAIVEATGGDPALLVAVADVLADEKLVSRDETFGERVRYFFPDDTSIILVNGEIELG